MGERKLMLERPEPRVYAVGRGAVPCPHIGVTHATPLSLTGWILSSARLELR